MAAKTTKVQLLRKYDNQLFDFEVTHAERLLAMTRGRWCLPKESEYTLDENGNISKRRAESAKRTEKA